MPIVPTQKVIVYLPGQHCDITYLLRVESTGVEISGPTFLNYEETRVQIWQWQKLCYCQLHQLDEAGQIKWLQTNSKLLYPKPLSKSEQPMSNVEVAAKLLEHPDYMAVVYYADNGFGDDQYVTSIWHDDNAKQTHINYL